MSDVEVSARCRAEINKALADGLLHYKGYLCRRADEQGINPHYFNPEVIPEHRRTWRLRSYWRRFLRALVRTADEE